MDGEHSHITSLTLSDFCSKGLVLPYSCTNKVPQIPDLHVLQFGARARIKQGFLRPSEGLIKGGGDWRLTELHHLVQEFMRAAEAL